MNDYFIVGLSVAGIELIYQRLMFPGNPLHGWFNILWRMRYNKITNDITSVLVSYLSKIIGYCHLCNSVWLAMIAHVLIFDELWTIFITMGITFIVLSAMLNMKHIIYVK